MSDDSLESRIRKIEDKTAYVVSDVCVSESSGSFCVDAAPDISLFSTAELLEVKIVSVRHVCHESVYQCRAVSVE